MDLVYEFISKLRQDGFNANEIRFLNANIELKKKLGIETVSEYSKKHNINSGSLSYMLKGKRAIPLSLLDSVNISKFRCMIKGCSVSIKIPKRLSPKLAYLIGLLRDGTVTKESKDEYVCAFYNTNRKLIETFRDLTKELFSIDSEIKKHWNGVYRIRFRSRTLYHFLTLIFGITSNQSIWDTPLIIKKSNDTIKLSYITGFFDAEGGCPHLEKNIDKRKKNLYIKFVQKNKESLIFIKRFLESKSIKTRSVYKQDQVWVLKIRNQSIPEFVKLIRSKHTDKSKRLKLLSSICRRPRVRVFTG